MQIKLNLEQTFELLKSNRSVILISASDITMENVDIILKETSFIILNMLKQAIKPKIKSNIMHWNKNYTLDFNEIKEVTKNKNIIYIKTEKIMMVIAIAE